MPFSLDALAQEINLDPQTYGYAAFVAAGNDQAVADLLNKVRTGDDGEAAIAIKRPDCSPEEILEAIDVRDFPAAPTQVNSVPLAQSYLQSVTRLARVRLTLDAGGKSLVRKNIDRLVGDTQGSQARLDAIAVRAGSRAEELFGFGTHVDSGQVAAALGRP